MIEKESHCLRAVALFLFPHKHFCKNVKKLLTNGFDGGKIDTTGEVLR